LIADGRVYCKFLAPGDAPEAEFPDIPESARALSAREYCNLHGYWKGEAI
jgi:superoxide reductase